jgi:hypothetical protein
MITLDFTLKRAYRRRAAILVIKFPVENARKVVRSKSASLMACLSAKTGAPMITWECSPCDRIALVETPPPPITLQSLPYQKSQKVSGKRQLLSAGLSTTKLILLVALKAVVVLTLCLLQR